MTGALRGYRMDDDALVAAVDLVGRTGARSIEVGYLHDDVPIPEAGWYAQAAYKGARIVVDDQPGPVEAAEGLARRILTGARCTRCDGFTSLGSAAYVTPGTVMTDGTVLTEEEILTGHVCTWRRRGRRWEPGCARDPRRSSRTSTRAATKKRGRR